MLLEQHKQEAPFATYLSLIAVLDSFTFTSSFTWLKACLSV